MVAELRAGFPDIIGNLTLQNFWCYKYESGESGIQVHADDAEVNLNFWVTPDESNTDLNRGGLVVWHQEPERTLEEDGGAYAQTLLFRSSKEDVRSETENVGTCETQRRSGSLGTTTATIRARTATPMVWSGRQSGNIPF
eukprot:COSAG02_NODE_5164_length_4578_cov_7.409243_3_plen_140_part_00